ncbi:MAG TPA: c-type cytochrome, partial [Acidimicrobiales bacterium]
TGPPQPPPRRQRVPMWAMPVVAVLPFWALLYAGAFGERNVEAVAGPAAVGARIYGPSCGGCHGPSGGGGSGPALADVTKTFPNFADHVAWVKTGSAPVRGQAYGAGSRVATGNMPGFEKELSEEEIIGVVCHERMRFGGAEDIPECAEGASPDAGEGEGGETGTEETENGTETAGGEAGG